MAKFYSGNRAQNILEMGIARARNNQERGEAEATFYEGRRCVEKWWIDKTTGEKVQLIRRIFVHQDENGRWVKD